MPGPTFVELAEQENQLTRELDDDIERAVARFLRAGGAASAVVRLLETWPQRYVRDKKRRP